MASASASAPPMDDALPLGWEQLIDASGRIYYGNPHLRIFQYERPVMNNPMNFQYFQNQLTFLEKKKNDLKLTSIESNLENIVQQANQLKNNLLKSNEYKCDKQCQKANESIESNTLDEFLNKDMNNIFKESK
jgi:hypothetical protein